MKRTLILPLLILSVSLGAIVNLGDEYIGSTPMGKFRKTGETESYSGYGGGEGGSTLHIYYYYNEFIPTRLDSIYSTTSSEYSAGSRSYYEYTEFDDYYLQTENVYTWSVFDDDPGYQLRYVTLYKYDYQDRILESHLTMGSHGDVDRILYAYDANGNLLLKTEYKTLQSNTIPYRVTTWEYDEQNRNTYSQITVNQAVAQTRWLSWSDHPLPDSTYILNEPTSTYLQEIHKNYFDENGERNYSVSMKKLRTYEYWTRWDRYYTYTYAHGLVFPIAVNAVYGRVSEPNATFVPDGTDVRNYAYTNDYHKVEVSPNPYEEYRYDDNMLLTLSAYRDLESTSRTRHISWQYYGPPISSDDPTAVPAAMVAAYPNPAKDNMNISLSKSNPPIEAKVYNIKGQLVRRLEVSEKTSDQYLYNWDCKDRNNRAVPAGVYLIRIKTNSGEISKKVTVIK
jgi:hypothetical protein